MGKMKNLAIIVDESLFRKIKIKIARADMTLKDYILGLIEEDFEKEQKESDT